MLRKSRSRQVSSENFNPPDSIHQCLLRHPRAEGMNIDRGIRVAERTWLYDGKIRCDVAIVRRDTFYGTGDCEDTPDLADDQHSETFEVLFSSPVEANRLTAGGGQYGTLDEARTAAELACGSSLQWHKG